MKTKNKIKRNWRTLRFGTILAGLLLLSALPAFSQSCALCYTQAALAGAKMIQALKSGILILVIPPTLGTIGMIFVVRHKRNQIRRTESSSGSGQDW
jgi:hypothetical protein